MIEHDLGGAMPRKISDERTRFWRDLIERQPTSGLTIARLRADAGANAEFVLRLEKAAARWQLSKAAPAMPRRKQGRKKAVAKSVVLRACHVR
jgi:hypothetical protein